MVIFHGKLLNYLKGSQNWGDVTINKTCLQGIYLFASCPAHVYFQGPNCIHRWPNKCQRNNRRKVVPLQSWLSKKRTMKRPEPEPFHITVGVNLCISPQVGWKKIPVQWIFRAPAAQLHILGQTVTGKSLTTAGATSANWPTAGCWLWTAICL